MPPILSARKPEPIRLNAETQHQRQHFGAARHAKTEIAAIGDVKTRYLWQAIPN